MKRCVAVQFDSFLAFMTTLYSYLQRHAFFTVLANLWVVLCVSAILNFYAFSL